MRTPAITQVALSALFLSIALSLPLPEHLSNKKEPPFSRTLQNEALHGSFYNKSTSLHGPLKSIVDLGEIESLLTMTGFMAQDVSPDDKSDNATSANSDNSLAVDSQEFPSEKGTEGENDFDEEPSPSRSVKVSSKKALRFFTEIDSQKIYGGLVTYSHAMHPARICRIMNACVRSGSTLVLPKWMKRYDSIISFHCGHQKLEFSLEDTSPPVPLEPDDLIGIHVSQPSMPDFIRDFMSNVIVFDFFYGNHEVTKTCHSRKGKDCDIFPVLAQDFRPLVYLHPRLEEMTEKRSWVRQFVKLMKPPETGKQAKIRFVEGNPENDESVQCYRSALFTRGPYNKNFVAKDHFRNMHFFRFHEIEKEPQKIRSESRVDQQTCKINITISNRKLIDESRRRLVGRYIMNIPELRKAILSQAKRVPGLRVQVSTMALESRSLRWQINAMQKTDIWVAGHGSLLTNMIFLRENSTVMEIQPFGFYPPSYEKMADHLAHVSYDRYIAHPDEEGFKACMLHFYPRHHKYHGEALRFLEKFSGAAAKYAQSDSTHSFVLTNFRDASLRHVRRCALMQRIDTNAENLAIAIVRHARLRCKLPKLSARTKSKRKTKKKRLSKKKNANP